MPQLKQEPSRSTTATPAADTAVAKPSSRTAVLPPATATLAALIDSAELAMVAIDRLDPSPWNREIREDDPELAGLADSIREVGILQPLLARPLGDRFQLLAGRRRMLAARLAGRHEVPVRIAHGVDDQRAEEITCIENLQRENLPFLDEAALIARLLRGTTQTALAARLGRTVKWISSRARLATLSEGWRELIRDPKGFASLWTEAHFEAVALLEPAAQDALLHQLKDQFQVRSMSVRELTRIVGDETRIVSTFPWHSTDAILDPQAGACSACPRRSSQHPTLFDIAPVEGPRARVARADRCLDPTCAARKMTLFLERERARLQSRHGDFIEVSDGGSPLAPGSVREWHLRPATRSAAGAIPGLLVNGPQAGAVRWFHQPTVAPKVSRQSGKRSLADRRALRLRQRQARAIGTLRTEILAAEAPPLAVLVRLAIVFGTCESSRRSDGDVRLSLTALTARAVKAPPRPSHPPREGTAAEPAADAPAGAEICDALPAGKYPLWTAFEHLGTAAPRLVERALWARVLPVLALRMTPLDGVPAQIGPAWQEAQRVAGLLLLDSQAHLDRATTALPDPKSWATEERMAAAQPSAKVRNRGSRSAGRAQASRKRASAA